MSTFKQQEQYWRIPATLSLEALTARIKLLRDIKNKSEDGGLLTTPANEPEVTSVKRNAADTEESPAVHKRRRIVVSDSSDDEVADDGKQELAADEEMNQSRPASAAAPAGRKRLAIVDSDSEWISSGANHQFCLPCWFTDYKIHNLIWIELNWLDVRCETCVIADFPSIPMDYTPASTICFDYKNHWLKSDLILLHFRYF